ncbi:peptidoglycan-associated lipoprotein [Halopseudomonas oceani]|uniref:Peptidoglycan-associated lipoprotein n=2 Tax=Halopseudomonas TaxID=2901189 RepID=A0AAQ1JQ38_9GAMM|nr:MULTISPECIES: peptidoglycan-associated lipoprotein Pal [Halopseudomonas]OWL88865.1 peptidoglycan-associated lipoprotein [Halopseudomonas aestusnigri]POB05767.1 peptidoglycan-associated lipoprotein Pal [Halopseudomonas oceani]GGE42048.1 peptidoglycan-associated lipoprotein [Halopseudomonas oceani]SEG34674.1 peptidoglycan-associated lipoprotein [Halopseudomonas aestusnigri]
MQVIKFGKAAALVVAFGVVVGCSSKGGDTSGAVDPNAGYGAGSNGAGMDNGMNSEEAALRAITTFYFEYDSSELKPEAMRALDVHAKDLKSAGNRVVLEGHTDERGTREYNMALGERRAASVQRYLVLQGVSPAQLELVSYGEEKPAAMGSTEEAMAQNRRVELRK